MIATLLKHCGTHYLVHYTGGVVIRVYLIHDKLPLSVKLRLRNADNRLPVNATYNDRGGWSFKR